MRRTAGQALCPRLFRRLFFPVFLPPNTIAALQETGYRRIICRFEQSKSRSLPRAAKGTVSMNSTMKLKIGLVILLLIFSGLALTPSL
ncbi:MAG: hypothetical protein FWC49_00265, partial [Proteobacteria bacterium]|nr:hypothetical protein [Pseudomonadota bacterium]